jgi:NAD(P)H dehydrogenase (quinone)
VAEAVKAGIESAGGSATILQCVILLFQSPILIQPHRYRIPETLSQEILTKMYAPAKPDYPIATPQDLTNYDAFLLGVPTRYGNFPAQWKVESSSPRQPRFFTSCRLIPSRHSGMLVATSGNLEATPASTQASSCPLEA